MVRKRPFKTSKLGKQLKVDRYWIHWFLFKLSLDQQSTKLKKLRNQPLVFLSLNRLFLGNNYNLGNFRWEIYVC